MRDQEASQQPKSQSFKRTGEKSISDDVIQQPSLVSTTKNSGGTTDKDLEIARVRTKRSVEQTLRTLARWRYGTFAVVALTLSFTYWQTTRRDEGDRRVSE